MKTWGKIGRIGCGIFVLALLTSACNVRDRIQEGQKVSLDPCKLVPLEKVQSVMGAPMYHVLDVRYTPEGDPYFDECHYTFSGSFENGASLTFELLPKTYKEARDIRVGDGGRVNESAKPLKDLGREARYRIREYESSPALDMVVLSSKGAKLAIFINLPETEASMLEKARALATPALARIERMFPGTESPPTDKGPAPVCLSVGAEGLAEIYKPLWPPASAEAVEMEEELQVGGPPKAGFGPVGGGWICEADPKPAQPVQDDDLPPGFVWWISKVAPAVEAPPGSQRLRGLAGAAFWRVDKGWWHSGFSLSPRIGTLSVFTKGGHHFEVEVDLQEGRVDESLAKRLATATAERIVTKLP